MTRFLQDPEKAIYEATSGGTMAATEFKAEAVIELPDRNATEGDLWCVWLVTYAATRVAIQVVLWGAIGAVPDQDMFTQ